MRRTIEPYLSGDTFRLNSNYILDETNLDHWPDLSSVKKNDVIFVKTDYLPIFYDLSKTIKEPFILITHNSDICTNYLTEEKANELLSRCKWFGQNNSNDKIISIPIGLTNASWHTGNPDNIFKLLPSTSDDIHRLFNKPRSFLVYMGFNPSTNIATRKPVADHFEKLGILNNCLEWNYYIDALKNSSFCICPEGNGPDTIRVWEALYCGCIPIVLSTTTPDLLQDLPVLRIDNWQNITIEKISQELNFIKKGSYNFEKLFYPYWKKQLNL